MDRLAPRSADRAARIERYSFYLDRDRSLEYPQDRGRPPVPMILQLPRLLADQNRSPGARAPVGAANGLELPQLVQERTDNPAPGRYALARRDRSTKRSSCRLPDVAT